MAGAPASTGCSCWRQQAKFVGILPCCATSKGIERIELYTAQTCSLCFSRPHHAPQVAAADVLLLAAAVESNSEHPLASAVVAFAHAFFQQQQQQQPAAQQRNGQLNGGALGGKGGSSISSGSNSGTPLPPCRDVAVAVGQGISAWVQLPPPATNGSSDGSGGTGSSSCAAQLHSRDALVRLQLAAAGSQAAGAPPAAAADGLAAEAAAGDTLVPIGEVCVAVGSRRLMAAIGLGVPPATEAYMHEQEVSCVVFLGRLSGPSGVAEPVRPGNFRLGLQMLRAAAADQHCCGMTLACAPAALQLTVLGGFLAALP